MDFLLTFLNSLPGAFGQGLAWGIMAIGVYITFRILDIADLTVDGSLATGGAVAALCISLGWNPWLALLMALIAGMLAGLVTGLFHTACGIPAILAGILTQLALYSINLRIMAIGAEGAKTKATLALSGGQAGPAGLLPVHPGAGSDQPFVPAGHLHRGGHRPALLVFRPLSWAPPCGPPAPTSHGPGPGHQHQLVQGAGPGGVQRPGGPVRRPAGPVSGQLYRGHGPGRHRHRPAAVIIGEVLLGKVFQNFALKLLSAVIGRHHLLCGHHPGTPPGAGIHRPEAAHRPGGGPVPVHPLLEGQVLYQIR